MREFGPWPGIIDIRRGRRQPLPPMNPVLAERMPTPEMLEALRRGKDRKLVRLVQEAAADEQIPDGGDR